MGGYATSVDLADHFSHRRKLTQAAILRRHSTTSVVLMLFERSRRSTRRRQQGTSSGVRIGWVGLTSKQRLVPPIRRSSEARKAHACDSGMRGTRERPPTRPAASARPRSSCAAAGGSAGRRLRTGHGTRRATEEPRLIRLDARQKGGRSCSLHGKERHRPALDPPARPAPSSVPRERALRGIEPD